MSAPNSVHFRFQTRGIPTGSNFDRSYQTMWVGDTSTSFITLEYTGSNTSGSYSGSSLNEYNNYGTLTFYPEGLNNTNVSASVFLPFFDEGWWNVMVNVNNNTSSIFAGNKIDENLGHTGSNSISCDSSYWEGVTTSKFPNNVDIDINSNTYQPFSGSYQEIKYYKVEIDESVFIDSILNPYSSEGNTINSSPDDLVFRADLGTSLNTGSRTSIHPRITGSAEYIKNSFVGDSSYYLSDDSFVANRELIYLDQPNIGIRNRVTDKIQINSDNLPNETSGSNPDITALSPLRSLESNTLDPLHTENIDYVEIGLSPSDEINDDIISQIGNFNIGDYIGDPRQLSSSLYNYPDLDTLRNAYFEKYMDNYDVVDFIRLIKFFDNSLFKMIKDFTPARTSLASGVIIKQHLLERNRHRATFMSQSFHDYEGTIKAQSRNFNTGSGDTGMYEEEGGSSVYVLRGQTGGMLERFSGLQSHPDSVDNEFFLTQSYSESFDGPLGPRTIINSKQEEFFDGEFSGSELIVTDQSLNPGCDPYKKLGKTDISFKPMFFSTEFGSILQGVVQMESWLDKNNSPKDGDAWIISEYDGDNSNVKFIKLPNNDINGNYIKEIAGDLHSLVLILPENESTEYFIEGFQINSGNVILNISNSQGDYNIFNSTNGGSENWSLEVQGDYVQANSNDDLAQGSFLNVNKLYQNQVIRYYNGEISSSLDFFNPGSSPVSNTQDFEEGAYNIERTPNIPWFIEGSLHYSASDLGFSGTIESKGLYHSSSNYSGYQLQSQDFTLSTVSTSGEFIPSPKEIDLDQGVFQTAYNQYILGNADVGELEAGHPQILIGGTASMDFYFPSLKLKGTPPDSSSSAAWTPLSGSALSANNDFSANFNGHGFFDNMDEDGSIKIVKNDVQGYIDVTYNDGEAVVGSTLNYCALKPSYTITANSSLNFTSSFQQYKDLTYANDPQVTGISTGNGSGVWSKVNAIGSQLFTTTGEEYFRFVMKSPETSPFDYTLTFSCLLTVNQDLEFLDGSTKNVSITNLVWVTNGKQGVTVNSFTPQLETGLTNNTVNIAAELYYTSSVGERLVTSSNSLIGEDIYEGKEFLFPDSPISIIDDENIDDSLYFIKYSLSNFSRGTTLRTSENVEFDEESDINTKLFISQSVDNLSSTFDLTGSVNIHRGNQDDTSTIGDIIFTERFEVANSESIDVFNFSSSLVPLTGFGYNDSYRMSISVDKSYGAGLTINEYTMSISPSSSIYSVITGPSAYDNYRKPLETVFLMPSYYGSDVLPFRFAKDCQPLLNNYEDNRENSHYMVVDYSNILGALTPINQQFILEGTAEKAETPDSNYTLTRNLRSKYTGTKTTSNQYNIWTPLDKDTYGKLPVIESRTAYFGYFNLIKDPYPNINNQINLNLTYLIDEEGNALPPSLEGIGYYNLVNSFPEGDNISFAIESGSRELKELNELYPSYKVGKYVTPIMYSQTSSREYTTEIPLTSSRYISRWDNDPSTVFSNFSFNAEGTGSNSDTDQTAINIILDPSEAITQGGGANVTSSYSGDGNIIIPLDYNAENTGYGETIPNTPFISVETKIDTSFLYESGNIELELKLILERKVNAGSFVPVPPTLDDVNLTVIFDNGEETEIGSVISDSNDIVRFVTGRTKGKKWLGFGKKYKKGTLNRKDKRIGSQSPIVNKNDEIEMVFENYPLEQILKQKGLNGNRKEGINTGGRIERLRWTLIANSGQNQFNQGDTIRWRVEGITRQGKEYDNYISPTTSTSFPTKIKMGGAYDWMEAGDNLATAPFWVYDSVNKNELIMSSPNMNEAYGLDSIQGDLTYAPGPTELFPGGTEPVGTQFDRILYPLKIEEGDEIRFGNNENYSYVINKVIPPQDNIDGNNGKLKIILDKEVPEGVNKDFFLVRRYIDNANSILVDVNFPYSNPPSGSTTAGILFPEYPVLSLQKNASAIITDLVGKGVIK